MNKNNERYNIFGPSWVEVNGVSYLLEKKYENLNIHYSLSSFFTHIINAPEQWVFLVIQPHEYAYFLYQVVCQYPDVKFVVFADNFYFSDVIILNDLGVEGFFFEDLIKLESKEIFSMPRRKLNLIKSYDSEGFIGYINDKILISLHDIGISFLEKEVLAMLAKGFSSESICKVMKISKKKVSAHKINGLKKLNCRKDRYAIIKGLQVRCNMLELI